MFLILHVKLLNYYLLKILKRNNSFQKTNQMSNHTLKTISDSYKELSKIDTFDPSVFIGDEKTPQALCDLMLALSLFCNDIKDTMMFFILVYNFKPNKLEIVSQEVGQFGGLIMYLKRLYVLQLEELSNLLRKNLKIIESEKFKQFLGRLPKENRELWNFVVDVLVKGKTQTNKYREFVKILTIIRNKTGGHYDAVEISKGYRIMFINKKNEPYLSGGSSISDNRFNFADAAAQGYYFKKQKDLHFLEFDKTIERLVENLSKTVWLLILRFINLRSSWKKPTQKRIPPINDLIFD